MLSLVVAHAANGVIGRAGGLPWHLPGDLRHFRELTSGHTVVMGRRTFESLPAAFRPLPRRRNLVLSTDPAYRAEGAEVFASLAAALDAAGGEQCFVIGGEICYREALPLARRVHATQLEGACEGDAFFPALDEAEWRCVHSGPRTVENEHAYAIRLYERIA
jgi:dihydrofolate reductase